MAPKEVADGVWVVTGGTFPSNSYICAADVPGGAILIDAGLDAGAIESALAALGLTPGAIFCTHGHFDHVGSAAHFQRRYGAPVHLHAADARTARTNNFLLMAIKRPERIEVPEFVLVDDGYSVDFGARRITYRHAPGHTPGSCVVSLGKDLFTGDTVYSRGVGLSKLPGERHDQLRDSILGLWEQLDQWRIHPGHGPSALGSDIKRVNSALQSFLGLNEHPFDGALDGSDVKGGA